MNQQHNQQHNHIYVPLPLRCSCKLQVLSSGLIQQAQAFVSDPRLPQSEGQAFRLHLIRVLYEQGEALAKVWNAAYRCNNFGQHQKPAQACKSAELARMLGRWQRGACSSPRAHRTIPPCHLCRAATMQQQRPC